MIKIKSISEPKLVTDEKELRYINEILPLECKICDLEQENIKLQKKLDKAIEIIIEIANKEFLADENAREIFRMCWLRYIEQELEK